MRWSLSAAICLTILFHAQVRPQEAPVSASSIFALDHRVIDAEYSDWLERIVTISSNPNRLHIYDPATNTEKAVDLSLTSVCVSVAPDGRTAVVGHNALLTHVDLVTAAVRKTYPITTDALDVMLGGNSYAYVLPRTDLWQIRSVDLVTGVETVSSRFFSAGSSFGKLHPGGKAIYITDDGIEKHSIIDGVAKYEYDQPPGGYGACGDLWMSEDGRRIFTRCGNAFRASDARSEDMVYNGALKELTYVRHLAQSSEAGRVVAIAETNYETPPADDTEIQIYKYDYLTLEARIKLPTFDVAGRSYAGHGKFVFFNKDGSKFFVLLEADKTSGLLNDQGIVQYTFSTAANPVPVLASISPTNTTAAGSKLTLVVYGSSFVPASVVRWGGKDRSTLYISSIELNASITAEDIAKTATVAVTVFNPAPGGGTSSASTFTIKNPIPSISSLTPSSATAGAADLSLSVYGSNFTADSVVRWNGNDRQTTYLSSSFLIASISAADLALEGAASVTVFNPTPAGGTSGSRSFTIESPLPVITSLSPSTVPAGGSSFTLYVRGRKFDSSSVVRWNGSDRMTSFSSSSDLSATIPAPDITTPGTSNVTVYNASPTSGVSNAKTFTISGGVPTFSITMTKTSYAATEAVGVSAMTLKNPDTLAQRIQLKVWMKVPTGSQVNLIDIGSDGSLQLPPGFIAELGRLTFFTVDSTSLKGTWELNSRIIDPMTLRFISEDINTFDIR